MESDNRKCEIVEGVCSRPGIRQAEAEAKLEEESRLREAREEARRITEEAKRSAERRAAIKAEAEREKKAKEDAMKKAVEAETQRLLQKEEEDRRRKAGFCYTTLFHMGLIHKVFSNVYIGQREEGKLFNGA